MARLQVVSARGGLAAIAVQLDRAFTGHPNVELYAVMIMCPLLMNMVQVSCQPRSLSVRSAPHLCPFAGGSTMLTRVW